MGDDTGKVVERIHYARWEIESLLAQAHGIARPLQSDFEIEWCDDHSAVIVLPPPPATQEPADGR